MFDGLLERISGFVRGKAHQRGCDDARAYFEGFVGETNRVLGADVLLIDAPTVLLEDLDRPAVVDRLEEAGLETGGNERTQRKRLRDWENSE